MELSFRRWSWGMLSVCKARFPFKRTQRTQRKRLHCVRCVRCVRCVNENRKQRKCLIGCFDDWMLRSTIPIGWRWRLRSLREKSYAMFFACVIFLRLLRFLCTFYLACVFFLTQGLACVACVSCVACVRLETGLKSGQSVLWQSCDSALYKDISWLII